MARTNRPKTKTPPTRFTHEGAPAAEISKELELRRSVLSCMLWEDTFYESGENIADRIMRLSQEVDPLKVDSLALYARHRMHLRHVPLWLCVGLARRGELRKETLSAVIQRADEMGEFLNMYWGGGDRQASENKPLPKQVQRGLAATFPKFDSYQLAKYDRATAVRLRDILFLIHAKPKDDEQAEVWKQLIDGTLPSPDTWEVGLSRGEDKGQTFERLLREGKLGYMALLRNLRNMAETNVPTYLIFEALEKGAVKSKALPFRFIAAAQAVPQWEPQIEQAMLQVKPEYSLPGRTVLLVDVSGSMGMFMSTRSKVQARDSAAGLAILAREICEKIQVATFSDQTVTVPSRRGFALRDAIVNSQGHGGTRLGEAVTWANNLGYDRLIVITDEQSHSHVPGPNGLGYMINVSSYENGVGYGPWVHIDGFSEATLQYIVELEKVDAQVEKESG